MADRNKGMKALLLSMILLIGAVVTIGGITRLTRSGLSIAEWKVVTGIIPPLTVEAWEAEFSQYKTTKEYQQSRQDMSLDDFKFIFFWEYLHRLAARIIGILSLAFALLYLRQFKGLNRWLTAAIPLLVILQGAIGYLMVRSGYKDIPHVSHFMLAIHLSMAFLTAMAILYLYFRISVGTSWYRQLAGMRPGRTVTAFFLLLGVQILYGAFVAGIRAGYIYNHWPLMGDGYIPPGLFSSDSLFENMLANSVTLQFIHRNLAIVLLGVSVYLGARSFREKAERAISFFWSGLTALVSVQFLLGVLTLIWVVPLTLGVLHQLMAYILILYTFTGWYFSNKVPADK